MFKIKPHFTRNKYKKWNLNCDSGEDVCFEQWFSFLVEELCIEKKKAKQVLHLLKQFRKSDNVSLLWHFSWSSPLKEVIVTSSWKTSSRQPRKKMSILPPLPGACVQFYVSLFDAIMLTAAWGTCSAPRSMLPASRYMIYILILKAHLWKESTNSFPNL